MQTSKLIWNKCKNSLIKVSEKTGLYYWQQKRQKQTVMGYGEVFWLFSLGCLKLVLAHSCSSRNTSNCFTPKKKYCRYPSVENKGSFCS